MTEFGNRRPLYPSTVSQIMEVAVGDSAWTAVTIPGTPAVNTKALAAKLRTGNDWKIAEQSGGSPYATVGGTLNIDITKAPGDVVFYAQTVSGDDTLEVLVAA